MVALVVLVAVPAVGARGPAASSDAGAVPRVELDGLSRLGATRQPYQAVRQAALASTNVSGTITTNTTWTTAGSPYVVTGNLTVNSGVTLTIDPGVVVKLNASARTMTVTGTLDAVGTSVNPIVFTSLQDDSAGGDTGGEGPTTGAAGQWNELKLQSAASLTHLRYVDVRFGGSTTAAVRVAGGCGLVKVEDTTMRNSQFSGLKVGNTSGCVPAATVKRSEFTDNGRYGVELLDGVLTLDDDSLVEDNTSDGVRFQLSSGYGGAQSLFRDSDITGNGGAGINFVVAETLANTVFPRGFGNNIYDNTGAELGDLSALTARDVEWRNNYFGSSVGYRHNLSQCSNTGKLVALPESGNPPAGPNTAGAYTSGGVLCYRDKLTIEPTEYSTVPVDVPSGITAGWSLGLDDLDAPNPSGVQEDPVNSATGSFTHEVTDVELSGTGVPFRLTRTYNSLDASSGPLGTGWAHSYSAALTVWPSGDVTLRNEVGQTVDYFLQDDGSYQGPPGSGSTLTKLGGGSYELLRHDQTLLAFSSAGKLTSVEDRNGEGLTLAYDGSGRLSTVTDSASRVITFTHDATSGRLTGVSLPDGRAVAYGYTSGRLTSVTDVRGKVWTYTWESHGWLEKEIDPLSHTVFRNVYSNQGRVIEQYDALNKKTSFSWDVATQTQTATDPNNHAWKHVYDGLELVKDIDALTNETQFGYDDDHNRTSVAAPGGDTTTFDFDDDGNPTSAVAPASLGADKAFVYNARNDPTSVTDARDKVTSYTYTAAGNVETVTQDGVQVASYTYDGSGRVATATDGNNKTTSYAYDSAGNVTSVTQPDPDGAGPLGQPVTTYTYNSQGLVLTRVDPKGNVSGCGCAAQYTTTYTHNAAGQLLTETDQLGHVTTTNVYDDAGRLTSSTDANSHTTTYTYDNANRMLTETRPDPDGAGALTAPVTTYTYDDAGNRLTETDPRSNTTTYAYDADNRLTSITGPDPDGAGSLTAPVTTNTYDAKSNLATTVDPRGNLAGADPDDYRTTYTYDAAGRLLTTTDPLGHTTSNDYDAVGNLESVTDANGHVTAYTYDAAGRILTVTAPDPDGAGGASAPVTTYTYDPVGNELTRTDANTHTTTTAYDALNHVTSVTLPDPDGGGSETPSVTTRSYDINGNLLTLVDANGNGTGTAGDGTTTYSYDRANRLTGIDHSDSTPDVTYTLDNVGNRTTMADGSGTETRDYDNLNRLTEVERGSNTFNYVYDAASNITKRTYPDSTVIEYSYDPLNRLSTIATGGNTSTYGYDAASNQTTLTLPAGNGYVETRSYDAAGRLITVKSDKGGTTLTEITYSRDDVGNPLTETRTGTSAVTKAFSYDHMDRLTGVCFQAGSCPGGSDPFIRWSYDGVGNRLTEQRPAGTTNYTYDNADRMTTAGANSYTYDRNGNQITGGGTTLTYDLANRTKTAVQGSTTTTYSYDGDGVRLLASTGSGASDKTKFLWDTNHALPQLALERDGNDSLRRRYAHGLRPLAITTGSGTSYYHYDPLGSVRDLTSASGATELTYDYEPYGATRSQTGTGPTNPLKFAGEYEDQSGLLHLRARQYVVDTSRFTARDPAQQSIGDVQVASYVYVANRPTAMVDPSGERFVPPNVGETIADDIATPGVGPVRRTQGVPKPCLACEVVEKMFKCTISDCTRTLSKEQAIELLGEFGDWNDEDATNAAQSFTGTIELKTVEPGWHFWRYYGGTSGEGGRYLTTFSWASKIKSPTQAIGALALQVSGNTAEYRQVVTAKRRTVGLWGRIRNSTISAYQFVTGNSRHFQFSPGTRDWWKPWRPPCCV